MCLAPASGGSREGCEGTAEAVGDSAGLESFRAPTNPCTPGVSGNASIRSADQDAAFMARIANDATPKLFLRNSDAPTRSSSIDCCGTWEG